MAETRRTEDTILETKKNIEFFKKRNKVEGFSLEPYTYIKDSIDEYGEKIDTTRNVINIGLELLFRLLYPNGKIYAETIERTYDEEEGRSPELNTCTARAYVYLDKHDDKDAFVVSEIGCAKYNPLKPDIGIEAAAHTYARTKALQKLGLGAEYGFPNSLYDEGKTNNSPQIIVKNPIDDFNNKISKTDVSHDENDEYKDACLHTCEHPSFKGITLGNIARRSPSFIKSLAMGTSACEEASSEDIKYATIIFNHDYML